MSKFSSSFEEILSNIQQELAKSGIQLTPLKIQVQTGTAPGFDPNEPKFQIQPRFGESSLGFVYHYSPAYSGKTVDNIDINTERSCITLKDGTVYEIYPKRVTSSR